MQIEIDDTEPYIFLDSRNGRKTLEVFLPYAPGNRYFLSRELAPEAKRKISVTYNRDQQTWSLPYARHNVAGAAILNRYGVMNAVVARNIVDKRCTEKCAGADPETRDYCTCVCIGENHGSLSPDYVPVAKYLLIHTTPTMIHKRITLLDSQYPERSANTSRNLKATEARENYEA